MKIIMYFVFLSMSFNVCAMHHVLPIPKNAQRRRIYGLRAEYRNAFGVTVVFAKDSAHDEAHLEPDFELAYFYSEDKKGQFENVSDVSAIDRRLVSRMYPFENEKQKNFMVSFQSKTDNVIKVCFFKADV